MFYIILLISISIILSYLILKCIYRFIFKSKKRISKFLVFLGSIALIIFYYTPYSFYLEPSFWQFRNICKLNELPNTEEKYNKILRYFDLSLDTLDWEKLNEKIWKIPEDNGNYKRGVFEYSALSKEKEINYRLGIIAAFYSNESPINRYNINQMSIGISWDTNRFYPDGNEGSGFYWHEESMSCIDIVEYNMIPKGQSNE